MTHSSWCRLDAIAGLAMAVLLILSIGPSRSATTADQTPLVCTFSIVAFDPENGDLGVAVQSKFPNVRPIVPWAKAGVAIHRAASNKIKGWNPRIWMSQKVMFYEHYKN